MRIFSQGITLIEVPGEVSMTFGVSGCERGCKGCSWAELDTTGHKVTHEWLRTTLESVKRMVTCVTFLGGTWCDELKEYLAMAQEMGFKTCLYTGEPSAEPYLSFLDYLKTGAYIKELGGLDSEQTNQKMIKVETGEDITHLFWRKEEK